MIVKSYLHSYEIFYTSGFDFLDELKTVSGKLVIIDKRVYEIYCGILEKFFDAGSIILIEALEDKKTIDSALLICEKALGISAKRNLTIIAIGGGIIQDIAAFTANILYRGVNLVLVPTTLLAQGDSCLGSKSSLNFQKSKNILGTFYPPKMVYICSDFLRTLTDMDFRSGLCEIARFHIMDNLDNIVSVRTQLDKLLSRDQTATTKLMKAAHTYKKSMVELDEFDLNQRKIFNYGHTFGHAIEAITNYAIPHGLAVALGIIMDNSISLSRGILDNATAQSIEEIFIRIYNGGKFSCTDYKDFINVVKKDKKRSSEGIASVLMSTKGSFAVYQDITEEEVINALDYIKNLVK